MSPELITLLGLGAASILATKNERVSTQFDNCVLNKILAPVEGVFNTFYSNKGLIIDYVLEESIYINTPFKELYGVEISGDYNVAQYLDNAVLEKLLDDYRKDQKGFFWYVIHKQGFYQKQYIFSYNRDLVEEIGDFFSSKILSGNKLANIVLDLYLKNYYWIEDKQIKKTIDLDFETESLISSYKTFNKIAKENIYTNINQTDLFQAYKMLDIKKTNIQKLLNLSFDGAIWSYFDLTELAVKNHLDLTILNAKANGNSQYFLDLKENYNNNNIDLVLCNSTLHISNYSKRIIGTLSNYLKTDYIRKDINRIETLRKTPLKYRDIQFDFLAPFTHLKDFIASVHKRTPENPDIWGYDKNGSFIAYSFTEENDAPHFMIIGAIGTGKSFQKQVLMSQIIGLDFNTMLCNYGNNEIRDYDIGYSDEQFVLALDRKPENQVIMLSSKFADFSYNICNIDFTDADTKEADLTFQADLVSLIIASKKGNILTIGESELFKTTLERIYANDDFRDYTIDDIEKVELRYKLIDEGYNLMTKLKDLPEKYSFLKTPLLKDIINYCSIQSENQQIKPEERDDYKSLALKLSDVNKLKMFSRFDEEDTRDVKFLHTDMNNFKESDLFVPIFTCIFQKRYLRDRERAINCRRAGKKAPKVFVFIEEAKNYFRVPYFETMFEKVGLEARKYNVHLGLVAQQPSHIPSELAKNIDTKIFLLKKDKKAEVIKDIKERYLPNDLVVEQLHKTDRFEMCVWYQKGAFNMKFEVTDEMFHLFNTNTNLIKEEEEKEDVTINEEAQSE